MLNIKHPAIAKLCEWRSNLLRDLLLTMAEALLVIAISYIPFFLITIDYIMSNSGSKFEFDILILVAKSYLKPGEALVYIAGILGSTTAYFILKIIMSPRKQMAFFSAHSPRSH
jgi:hypothetical protein